MGKYEPLADFLRAQRDHSVKMAFEELERLIADRLPKSARERPEWWMHADPEGGQAQARDGWAAVGWRVQSVDLDAERVTFARGVVRRDADRSTGAETGPGADDAGQGTSTSRPRS